VSRKQRAGFRLTGCEDVVVEDLVVEGNWDVAVTSTDNKNVRFKGVKARSEPKQSVGVSKRDISTQVVAMLIGSAIIGLAGTAWNFFG
jgi:hypothetical protein